MTELVVRRLEGEDLARLEALFAANQPTFSDVDIKIGLEVARGALAPKPDEDPYLALVLEQGEQLVGFAAYGQVPLTHGTYDLYWIVVHPAVQGAGLGRRLLAEVERDMLARGGHQVIIETSSRSEYERARRLYLRCGCSEVARITDFYRPGEDRVIYRKALVG